MDIFNTLVEVVLKDYGIEVIIAVLLFSVMIILIKKLFDYSIMNDFDKLFLPKIKKYWEQAFSIIGLSILANIYLTTSSFILVKLGISKVIISLVGLVAVIILLVTITIIIGFILLKPIIILLQKIKFIKNNIFIRIFSKIKKPLSSLNPSLKTSISEVASSVYKNFILVSAASIFVLYTILISEYYGGIEINKLDISLLIEIFIKFNTSTVLILFILFVYRELHRSVYSIKNFNSDFLMKIIDKDKIDDKNLYYHYMLDEQTMILGSSTNYEESTTLYLYDKENDTWLEFSKVKNDSEI